MVASKGLRLPAGNFIKKETPEKMFFCEFCKIVKKIVSFDRATPDDCFLCLSVNFKTFFRTLLLWSTSGKLFHIQVAEFQPPDTEKSYFTGGFQEFYVRTRSSHSKAFIYLKSLKTVKTLICYKVARCLSATLRKKALSHILLHFALIF